MYDIEVENKNNIMNFYENKLTLFQRDKMTLISRYEEKISHLGSGGEMNAIIMQANNNTSVIPKISQRVSNTNPRFSNTSQPISDKLIIESK